MISSLMKKRKIPDFFVNPWIPENRSNPWRVGKYEFNNYKFRIGL